MRLGNTGSGVCYNLPPCPAGPPTHVCRGCCSDRDESVEKGVRVLQETLLTPVLVPAMNKWTKVAPCICHISAMQHFCGLLPAAFQAMAGQARTQPDEADSSDDEGAALGVPVNETRSWRRLARQRLAKACHFPRAAEGVYTAT